MADDRRGYPPPRDSQDPRRGYPPREEDPRYPPPSGEDDDRAKGYGYRPNMTSGVTLPSIQDAPTAYGAPAGRGYPPPPPPPPPPPAPDSRVGSSYGTSPNGANGYPPPTSAPGAPGAPGVPVQPYSLPPVQPPPDARSQGYSDYYQRGPPAQYTSDPYAAYGGRYPPPPPHFAGYGGEYGRPGVGAPPPQAAPRQRTSIACRYCRKRKIRCSGYQSAAHGKCINCNKSNQECIFQPVSSSSSTAFIPVSALPGGVPPGTTLYGAFGQPLPPDGNGQPAPYPGAPADYPQGLPSPTSGYYPDDRSDSGRRRQRPAEEEHPRHLPPPNFPPNDDPRRRSPASNHSSPGNVYGHQPVKHEDERTPTPPRSRPGEPQPPPSGSQRASSVMSLGNLMDLPPRPQESGSSIDQSMLGRLNRRS